MWQAPLARTALAGLGVLLVAAAVGGDETPYTGKYGPLNPYHAGNPYGSQLNPYHPGNPYAPYTAGYAPHAPDVSEALNAGLKEVRELLAQGVAGADVVLHARWLARLNMQRGPLGAESGLLQTAGSISWPALVLEHSDARQRAQVGTLLQEYLKTGRPETLTNLRQALQAVTDEFRAQVNQLPAADYIAGKRFLTRLETTARALAEPAWRADLAAAEELPERGKTLISLARYLGEKQLQTAPALPGDEAAYQDVARALRTYLERSRPRIDPDLRPIPIR